MSGVAHQFGKQRQVGVRHEELGGVWIEAGVGRALDGRHVNLGVIYTQVITQSQNRDEGQQREPDNRVAECSGQNSAGLRRRSKVRKEHRNPS